MQAVEFSNSGMVLFSSVELPEPLRQGIVDGRGGLIRDDVRVIHPCGPEHEYWPNYVLCVSRTDPHHYKFIDRRQVDSSRLRIVDSAFRVLGTVEGWWKFLKLSAEMQAMMANVTGVEATGSLEDPD
jgi:hypothetical protein